MVAPSKLSHVVLQTNDLRGMRDWYCNVLDARVTFENDALCFMTYDDEHHRIGLVAFGQYGGSGNETVGLHHVSFCYDKLEDLLENFKRLDALNIRPEWCVNHGPTVSLYYADPEGNRVELQIDVFETTEEVNHFINGPVYQQNPAGVDFDPHQMLAELKGGKTMAELAHRSS